MVHHPLCKEVIEHGVEIKGVKNDMVEIQKAIKEMANTANRIYMAVLVAMLSLLGNVIIYAVNYHIKGH